MTVWYPLLNTSGTITSLFGQLNNAVSGNVLPNGDFYWSLLDVAIFMILLFTFFRNNFEFWSSLLEASFAGLVISTVMYTLGFILIYLPLTFIVLLIIGFLIAIITRPIQEFQ